MIKATDIHKSYGALEVLRGVSLEVSRGEVVSIVGASGAGKTTLLQILGTLSKADRGSVEIDGQDVSSLGDRALSRFRNEKIGFVFQFHHLLPEFTAFENVCIPGLIGRRPKAEVERRAGELLALVGLTQRRDHKPGELSGGEQQRVAIARALVNSPAVLLADEPSGNLDTRNKEEVHRLFFDLRERLGQTIVLVTHDESLYDRYSRTEFIAPDPISGPQRFEGREDREIAGFLSATIAWGNRRAIVGNACRMMSYMDNAPADFVKNASEEELRKLTVCVHRTFNGEDLIAYVRALRSLFRRYGSLGEFFEGRYAATGSIPSVLSDFRREFFAEPHPIRSEKHLSSIDKGSACKRLNMFLRWMVRRDDRGVDFGLWRSIPMSALYLPLDLHSGNVARTLGLLVRRQNDWRAVEEVTAVLRTFDPEDPVRYDFALFGAGMDGFLKG